jgi:hypothetical protein
MLILFVALGGELDAIRCSDAMYNSLVLCPVCIAICRQRTCSIQKKRARAIICHVQQVSETKENSEKTYVGALTSNVPAARIPLVVLEFVLSQAMCNTDIGDGALEYRVVESESPQRVVVLLDHVGRTEVVSTPNELGDQKPKLMVRQKIPFVFVWRCTPVSQFMYLTVALRPTAFPGCPGTPLFGGEYLRLLPVGGYHSGVM